MSQQKILIITHTEDNNSVDKVIERIDEAGATAIRLNTDLYPLSLQLTTLYQNNEWQIILQDGQQLYQLQDVTAVWFRRSYHLGNGLKEVLEKQYLNAAINESRRTLFGMLEGLPCFHLERFSTYRRLDSKEEQLKVAAQCGLLIPSTCISNDPVQVKQFLDQHPGPVITKMQHAFSIIQQEEELVVFTNEVGADSLDELASLQYCPMVFQQLIEKKLELRITIVGDRLFAFAINSQQNSNARVDWRKEGERMIDDWQPYDELPALVQQQLLRLMDYFGLNYGGVDMILTPDDKYYFLEVNAAGEFFWLDRLCNHAISKHIGDLLMGKVYRR